MQAKIHKCWTFELTGLPAAKYHAIYPSFGRKNIFLASGNIIQAWDFPESTCRESDEITIPQKNPKKPTINKLKLVGHTGDICVVTHGTGNRQISGIYCLF